MQDLRIVVCACKGNQPGPSFQSVSCGSTSCTAPSSVGFPFLLFHVLILKCFHMHESHVYICSTAPSQRDLEQLLPRFPACEFLSSLPAKYPHPAQLQNSVVQSKFQDPKSLGHPFPIHSPRSRNASSQDSSKRSNLDLPVPPRKRRKKNKWQMGPLEDYCPPQTGVCSTSIVSWSVLSMVTSFTSPLP